MSWLTSRKNTITWHRETGYLPVRNSAMESLELQSFHKSHPNFLIPIEQLPYARPLDFTPHIARINTIVRFAMEEILINRKDPGTVLKEAAIQMNTLLQNHEGATR
jgi:ABC-type glycerol-3-phosphate transport system substrate-binding protein